MRSSTFWLAIGLVVALWAMPTQGQERLSSDSYPDSPEPQAVSVAELSHESWIKVTCSTESVIPRYRRPPSAEGFFAGFGKGSVRLRSEKGVEDVPIICIQGMRVRHAVRSAWKRSLIGGLLGGVGSGIYAAASWDRSSSSCGPGGGCSGGETFALAAIAGIIPGALIGALGGKHSWSDVELRAGSRWGSDRDGATGGNLILDELQGEEVRVVESAFGRPVEGIVKELRGDTVLLEREDGLVRVLAGRGTSFELPIRDPDWRSEGFVGALLGGLAGYAMGRITYQERRSDVRVCNDPVFDFSDAPCRNPGIESRRISPDPNERGLKGALVGVGPGVLVGWLISRRTRWVDSGLSLQERLAVRPLFISGGTYGLSARIVVGGGR